MMTTLGTATAVAGKVVPMQVRPQRRAAQSHGVVFFTT